MVTESTFLNEREDMTKTERNTIILRLTQLLAERLTNAATTARSAAAVGIEGNAGAAVEIALGLDQALYEATTLLNAMTLIDRVARD